MVSKYDKQARPGHRLRQKLKISEAAVYHDPSFPFAFSCSNQQGVSGRGQTWRKSVSLFLLFPLWSHCLSS
jgi:hypothetical protein